MFLSTIAVSSTIVSAEDRVVKIGIEQYKPITFMDENGEITGFSVDVINEIARIEGWNVEYILLPWEDCIEGLKTGELDLLIAIVYIEERDQFVDYTSDYVVSDWAHLYVKHDSEIQTIYDLEGKRIAANNNSFNQYWPKEYLNLFSINTEDVLVSEFEDMIDVIINDEADVALLAISATNSNKNGLELRPISNDGIPTYLYCAVPEGKNQDLIEGIDRNLFDFKNDENSVYYDIEQKWFASSVKNELPAWVKYTLLSFAGALILFISLSFILKYQVNKRTAELKISNMKYFNLVENGNDGIAIIQDQKIVFCNPKLADIVGYEIDEVMGKDVIPHIADRYKNMIMAYLHKRIAGDPNIPSNYELSILRKNGDEVSVEISSSVIEHEGRVATMIILRDIEERKVFEKMMQEKTLMEASDRTKSEFLGNMSHELRTPLNSIIGFSDMLSSNSFGELNEKQQKYVTHISESGNKLLNIVNNILEIFRAKAGEIKYDPEKFNFSSAIRGSITLVNALSSNKNIEISYDINECDIEINADRPKIMQVMYNLLTNAIKFTEYGGKVSVSCIVIDNVVRVAVKDTGKGIDQKDIKKIFYPFAMIYKFSTKEESGAGLGLSLVRNFVEMHGGTVWVESELDVGSTFYFELPIEDKSSENM